jgi:hypothetical protein
MTQKNGILVKNGMKVVFTHFKFSRCFGVNGDPALGHLRRVELGSSAEVSEERVVSIFSIKINKLDMNDPNFINKFSKPTKQICCVIRLPQKFGSSALSCVPSNNVSEVEKNNYFLL